MIPIVYPSGQNEAPNAYYIQKPEKYFDKIIRGTNI